MKQVNLSEARANIAKLLDEVERGETVTISRDGKTPVYETLPSFDEKRLEEGRQAMRELRELRKQSGKASTEEILGWRDEGRRF